LTEEFPLAGDGSLLGDIHKQN